MNLNLRIFEKFNNNNNKMISKPRSKATLNKIFFINQRSLKASVG